MRLVGLMAYEAQIAGVQDAPAGRPLRGRGGADRLPAPTYPPGLRWSSTEGVGEVQTPLRGPGAEGLRVGDRVWFRHAKAGEVCEHVDVLHTVSAGEPLGSVPTYRGEGRSFG